MTELRCLSLLQPWASLIAVGVKTIETRSWPTKVRGRIGIASTAKRPSSGSAGSYYWEPVGRHWELADREDQTAFLPLGALVATAKLVDCVPIVAEGDLGTVEGTGSLIAVSRTGEYVTFLSYEPNAVSPGRYIDKERTENLIAPNRPYGDYTPGRWAWLLDDIKPTSERCPACEGLGFVYEDPPGSTCLGVCPTCDGAGKCDPISVKGKQGFWWWQP